MDRAISRRPVLQAAGHPDNFQTPAHALDPLLPYLRPNWLIWEPACGKGNLVEALSRHHRVLGSDLLTGQDFLKTAPEQFDAILTNPPYSKKDEFLARCYDLGKPFALLLPLTVFDSVKRQRLFARHGVEILFMPRLVKFETPNGAGSSSWFATAWVTWGMRLPKPLTFSGIEV